MKRLSIVIPTYNRCDELQRCVNSVLTQKADIDYDIVVVDDGSGERTSKYLLEILSKHDNIRVLSQNNQGPAAARNKGISTTESEYILFIDDDCELKEGFLKELSKIIDDKVDVIHANCLDPYEDNYYNKMWQVRYRRHVDSCPETKSGVRKVHILGNCYAIKRTIFEKTGLFDENLITKEDTDMIIRMHEHNIDILHYDSLQINHYSRIDAFRTIRKRFLYQVGTRQLRKKYPEMPDFLKRKKEDRDRFFIIIKNLNFNMRKVRATLIVENIGFSAGVVYVNLKDHKTRMAVHKLKVGIINTIKNMVLWIQNR